MWNCTVVVEYRLGLGQCQVSIVPVIDTYHYYNKRKEQLIFVHPFVLHEKVSVAVKLYICIGGGGEFGFSLCRATGCYLVMSLK